MCAIKKDGDVVPGVLFTLYKVFSGERGFYAALEGKDGYHCPPPDEGASNGWDFAAAKRRAVELDHKAAMDAIQPNPRYPSCAHCGRD